ncbi:MAG: hypothetical protein K5Q68_22055 [Roseococcus sp.]|nr:hypothetical protein [Roseococcus sp.]
MKPPSETATARALEAWGDALPAWVLALATACDDTSQSQAAKRIGYSAATISLILRRGYPGELTRVEQAVRGAWMGDTVACPALHQELPTNECVGWQRRKYDPSNHQTVRMFMACRSCPQNSQPETAGGEA